MRALIKRRKKAKTKPADEKTEDRLFVHIEQFKCSLNVIHNVLGCWVQFALKVMFNSLFFSIKFVY